MYRVRVAVTAYLYGAIGSLIGTMLVGSTGISGGAFWASLCGAAFLSGGGWMLVRWDERDPGRPPLA